MHHSSLTDYIQQFSYLGIFLWFAVIEQVTPIPEEVYLISLGYVAIHVGLNPFLSGIVALAGLLATDNVLYYLSLKGNKLAKKLLSKINPAIMERIERNFKERSVKTLFVTALIPKLRFFSPIIAGTLKVRWPTFLFINGGATLFYVIVYMCIGIFFHNQLTAVLKKLDFVQHGIFIVVMIIVAVFVAVKAKNLIFKKTASRWQ